METSDPAKLVMLPDAFGEALLTDSGGELLRAWRDGRVRPVVSRTLLVRYLRLLRRLALSDRLLRWWGWWLGSEEKVLILPEGDPELPLPQLCLGLAIASEARFILVREGASLPEAAVVASGSGPERLSVDPLLRALERSR